MEYLWQDVRFGLRFLGRNRGITLIAVTALALGIGANSAIFSVVNAVLIRRLPYPASERLVMVWEDHQKREGPAREWTSPANFSDWREQSHSIEEAGAFMGWSPTLTGIGEPEQLRGARVTHGLFEALGVDFALGRGFTPEEDSQGGNRVVVLSHGLWLRRFASDPAIVGRSLILGGQPHTVIGIMPERFRFPLLPNRDIWTTLQMGSRSRGAAILRVIARLKPEVSLERAQAEFGTIAGRLEAQYPGANMGVGISLVTLHEQLMGDVRRPLLILLGAVGLVLLIACANVANLLLAKAAARRKEIGIRLALGAPRGRVLRQLLTESVLLSGCGGALGLLLAHALIAVLLRHVPDEISTIVVVRIDSLVLGFTALLSIATGIVFGTAPALQSTRPDMVESLKEGDRGAFQGARHKRLRSSLVVAEMALSVMLLAGAGLLLRSFLLLQNVQLGFNPNDVLTLSLILPRLAYGESSQVDLFYTRLLEGVRRQPGVRSVAATSSLPLSGEGSDTNFMIEGRPEPPPDRVPVAWYSSVSPGYHECLGIPLIRGRTFTDQDRAGAPGVVVINETMARRHWPNEDPIGRRIGNNGPNGMEWREIVGIVGNVKFFGLDREQPPAMYFPMAQDPSRGMTLVVRTSTDLKSSVPPLRREVWSLDKNLAIAGVTPMHQLVSDAMERPRSILTLLAIFAGSALILAEVGIYGVMAFAVSQRTHEIGVRMALGARSEDVLKMILGEGVILALLGVAVGLTGTFAAARMLEALLFGVSATDPITYAAVCLILILVAISACWIPARRATRVDPMVALRYE